MCRSVTARRIYAGRLENSGACARRSHPSACLGCLGILTAGQRGSSLSVSRGAHKFRIGDLKSTRAEQASPISANRHLTFSTTPQHPQRAPARACAAFLCKIRKLFPIRGHGRRNKGETSARRWRKRQHPPSLEFAGESLMKHSIGALWHRDPRPRSAAHAAAVAGHDPDDVAAPLRADPGARPLFPRRKHEAGGP